MKAKPRRKQEARATNCNPSLRAALESALSAREQILEAAARIEDDDENGPGTKALTHLRRALDAVNAMQHCLIGVADSLSWWEKPLKLRIADQPRRSERD